MIKKTTKKESISFKRLENLNFKDLIKNSDSYKSLLYGALSVIVVFFVIILGVKTLTSPRSGIIDEKAAITENSAGTVRQFYKVGAGETLWSIAEKTYGDGFKWNEIAKANNITDAMTLEEGTELTIPKISTSLAQNPTITPTPTVVTNKNIGNLSDVISTDLKISGSTYTIQEGDNLWTISVRAYGDGYKWMEIAKANNITDYDLIFSGNVLRLPR